MNSRAVEHDIQRSLNTALRAAQQGPSVQLLVSGGEVYRDVTVEYRGGPRFPRLQRSPGTADLLSAVAASHRSR